MGSIFRKSGNNTSDAKRKKNSPSDEAPTTTQNDENLLMHLIFSASDPTNSLLIVNDPDADRGETDE